MASSKKRRSKKPKRTAADPLVTISAKNVRHSVIKKIMSEARKKGPRSLDNYYKNPDYGKGGLYGKGNFGKSDDPKRPTKKRPTKKRPTKKRPTKKRPTKKRPTKKRPTKKRPTKKRVVSKRSKKK